CSARADVVPLRAPVVADPRPLGVRALRKAPPPAREARPVLTAVPADPDPLSRFPLSHARADRIDDTGDLVTWNTWVLDAGPAAFLHEHFAMTHAARLDSNANLAGPRLRDFPLDDLEISDTLRDLRRLHLRHRCAPSIQSRFTTDSRVHRTTPAKRQRWRRYTMGSHTCPVARRSESSTQLWPAISWSR